MAILGTDTALLLLLNKVYQDTGCDFRQYKETTLKRRIERRLHATNAQTYADYMAILDTDVGEYDQLLSTLTIKVTEFLREPDAFNYVGRVILPEAFSSAEKSGRGLVRMWSAGCASGEEPYSLAMLICEVLGERVNDFDIAIHATDMDKESLSIAKKGEYEGQAVLGLERRLVKEYFSEDEKYNVRPEIRRSITFGQHNLASDPPLFDLDLIVCRNVVIYFSRELQERVFMGFYRGLRPGGFLFLGKAETLTGRAASLFHTISKELRVYQKLPELGGWKNGKGERQEGPGANKRC